MARIVNVLLLCLFAPHVLAEVWYYKYALTSTVNTTATNLSQCAASCLQTTNCVAISFCFSGTYTCMLSNCGNVRLLASASCNTTVFADVDYTDGVDVPSPIQEWMLSGSCTANSCGDNTGSFLDSSLTLSGANPSTNLYGYFFGKSIPWSYTYASSISLSAISSVTGTTSVPTFSLLLWFKLFQLSSSAYLFDLRFSQAGAAYQSLGVSANISGLFFSSNLTGCGNNCTQAIMDGSVLDGLWHYMAVVYTDKSQSMLFYVDGVTQLSLYFSSPLISTTAYNTTMFFSGTNVLQGNMTIFCYKIFNVSLQVDEVKKVASTCFMGKISYVNSSTSSSDALVYQSSNSNAVKKCSTTAANWTLDGKYYYYKSQWTGQTFYQAYNICNSLNYTMVKLESPGEMMFLNTFVLPILNSISPWISLYGNLTTNKLSWLSDNSTFDKTKSPLYFDTNNCCGDPLLCYIIRSINSTTAAIDDSGCVVTTRALLCQCTEY